MNDKDFDQKYLPMVKIVFYAYVICSFVVIFLPLNYHIENGIGDQAIADQRYAGVQAGRVRRVSDHALQKNHQSDQHELGDFQAAGHQDPSADGILPGDGQRQGIGGVMVFPGGQEDEIDGQAHIETADGIGIPGDQHEGRSQQHNISRGMHTECKLFFQQLHTLSSFRSRWINDKIAF